jgi:hypothetical protein
MATSYRYGADKPYLSKFTPETLGKIAEWNNQMSGKKEWLADIYQDNDGNYILGEYTTGNYDGITVSPEGQLERDIASCKLSGGGKSCDSLPKRLVSTVHMHPIRMMAEEKRRQNFSGTDIASEWGGAVKKDKEHVLFLSYPELGLLTRKNKLKAIRFPNRDVSIKAMQKSNPGIDPYSINPQDDASRDSVDWIKLQKELENMGYIETVTIEDTIQKKAAPSYQMLSYVVVGAAVAALVLYLYLNKQDTTSISKIKESFKNFTTFGGK